MRDENGDEILVESGKIDKDGNPELDKVPDDQTLDIPAMFEAWKREEGLGW